MGRKKGDDKGSKKGDDKHDIRTAALHPNPGQLRSCGRASHRHLLTRLPCLCFPKTPLHRTLGDSPLGTLVSSLCKDFQSFCRNPSIVSGSWGGSTLVLSGFKPLLPPHCSLGDRVFSDVCLRNSAAIFRNRLRLPSVRRKADSLRLGTRVRRCICRSIQHVCSKLAAMHGCHQLV